MNSFDLCTALVCLSFFHAVVAFQHAMFSKTMSSRIQMVSNDLVTGALPTIEEWLDVAEPGLKKATMAMFRYALTLILHTQSNQFTILRNDFIDNLWLHYTVR